VGDVHQPLHVGFIGNLGGNKLTGTFLGKNTNLHSLWDSGIITQLLNTQYGGDMYGLADDLIRRINGEWAPLAAKWKKCTGSIPFSSCPDQWADESAVLACDNAYVGADGKTPIKNGFTLGIDYYDRNVETVMLQLAKSGVRMANVLNNLYLASQLL